MANEYRCTYRGKRAKVVPHRVALNDTGWFPLNLPSFDPRWVYWRIRNLDDANGLDVSFEEEVPANNPNYFEIDPRGPEGVLDDDKVFPSHIWLRRQAGAAQNIYYEYVILEVEEIAED